MAELEAVLDAPEEIQDAPIEETPEEVDEPLDVEPEAEGEEEPAEEEEEAPAEEEEEQVTTDGRKMPDSLKKAVAALKATNPEASKAIRGLYFAEQEYRSVFAKPADAVAAKSLIDEIGGQEGIQQIQAEREEWSKIDQDFAEGKPDFVKSLAEGNPEAFLKVAPLAINEWATRAPEQYGYYANTVAINTMAQAGLSLDVLANAYQRYADNPQAQAIIAEVHNKLAELKDKTTQFEQKRTDPREEQLKQRETQFEQRRRADFEGGIANQAGNYLKEKMQPEIDRVMAGRKVDPEAADTMRNLVNAEIEKRMGEIPNIANQLEAFYRTGDSQKSLDYIKTQYNRILPDAVKKVIAPLYRNIQAPTPIRRAGAPAARPAAAGEVTLKEMPDNSAIDWSKTTVADVIQGKAILTNGKKASGWA